MAPQERPATMLGAEFSALEKVPPDARVFGFWDQAALWFGAASLPAAWYYGALMAGWKGLPGAVLQGAFAIAGHRWIRWMEWLATVALVALGVVQTVLVLSAWKAGTLFAWTPPAGGLTTSIGPLHLRPHLRPPG